MKTKKRILILVIACIIIAIIAIVIDKVNTKEYFIELSYDEIMTKLEKKESFVLCLSQTTCSHCAEYKPKLKQISKQYKTYLYYTETNLFTEEQTDNFQNIISFKGTPTTVFITNGEEKTVANRISGDLAKEKIIKKLKSNGFIK